MFYAVKRIFYHLFHDPEALLIILLDRLYFIFPDKLFIELKFRLSTGYKLNLSNPRSFNEKLQWLKLNDHHDKYTQMVDKVEAKNYVASIIGPEYIIPTLGVWDSVDDIPWNDLPHQFVVKSSGDSGGVVVCKDKNCFNIAEAKEKLRTLGTRNYYNQNKEYPYKDVPHRYLAETYMVDESGCELKDYKFFCFNGKVQFLKVDFNRFVRHQANYYDRNMNLLPFEEVICPQDPNHIICKPENFDLMISLAELLSEKIPFVRVDFYNIRGRIFFGELTFFPASGWGKFNPEDWDYKIGEYLNLPR